MAVGDPRRYLTDEENKIIEESEEIMRIVSKIIKALEEDKDFLRKAGKEVHDELEKRKQQMKSDKGKHILNDIIKVVKEFGDMKRVGPKTVVKKLTEILENNKKEIEMLKKKIEELEQKDKISEYTYGRTSKKLSGATEKIKEIQKEIKATKSELDKVKGENSELAYKLQKRIDGLKIDMIRYEIYDKFGVSLTTENGQDRAHVAKYELWKEVKDKQKKTKEQKKNQDTSDYDKAIQSVIDSLKDRGINLTYKDVENIIKDEVQPTLVKKHPFEAVKTMRAKDETRKVNAKTKKSIGLRLATLTTTIVIGLSLLVAGGSALGVNLNKANKTNEEQGGQIIQVDYRGQEETLSAKIKEGAAYIYNTEENADEKIQDMGKTSNGYFSLAADDIVLDFYNEIKDASEKTSDIIFFDEKGSAVGGAYLDTIKDFETAIKAKDTSILDECMAELKGYADVIGGAYNAVEENIGNIETVSAKTENTYYQQANKAWEGMNKYIDSQYSEIVDLVTTPVLDVEFDVNEIKSDADLKDIITGGKGAVKDVLSCKYERETGKVTMLVEGISPIGSAYTVEVKFEMAKNLKVVNSEVISEGMKEAEYGVTLTKFDTSLSTSIDGSNVSMNVGGKEVSGQAKILYNIDAVYFEGQDKTKVNADAIVMITQEDGSVVYKTFDYKTSITGFVEEKDVESAVLTELINKINASLGQEIDLEEGIER